jgi:PAS domain S-box-containing protein
MRLVLIVLIGVLLVEYVRKRRANEALVDATKISAATGDAFFRSLVLHLCRVLKTDYVSIGELSECGKRIQTVAIVADGQIIENLEYELANTPCEKALELQRCIVPDNVQEMFSLDVFLPTLGIRSYLGVALVDSEGVARGVMSVMSRWRLRNVRTAAAILDIFAHRAAAEIERRRSVLALQKSESKNRAILKAFPDLMFVQDREGTLLDYYTKDEGELYLRPEQFLGRKVHEVLPPDVAGAIARGAKETAESHEPVSFEYSLQIQEETRFYEARMVDLDTDKVLTIVRNVTTRKHAENALEEARRFNQRVAETIPNVLFVYDLMEQRNVYVNDRAGMLGYTAKEVLHMGDQFLRKTMHPDDLARLAAVAQDYSTRKDGEIFEHLFRFRHKNGEWRWIQRFATVFTKTADGRPKQILGTATDVTALKKAEQELRSLSARLLNVQDEERRRIARELHDGTAQSLFAISLNVASLRQSRNLPGHAKELLDECQMLCEDSLKEVRSLSYLLHPPLLDQAGLVAALKWFTDGFSRRSGIAVELEIPESMERMALGLERDLFRIVQEALGNVARHSGSTKALVRVDRHTDQVILRIQDFGHGIASPSDEEPDASLTAGVGIASMRERLRHVGGQLEIQSNDQGTTLIAIVPIRSKNLEQTRGRVTRG